MKYEFDGITTEQDLTGYDKYKDFYEMYETVLIEKEPFTVELDNKEVKLHLYIEDLDMAEFEEDTTDHIISVGILPDFKSLSKNNQNRILEQYTEDERELLKKDKQQQLQDIHSYGMAFPLRSVTVTEVDKVDYTINSAIAVRTAISRLIGFELDRPMNRIGNTGWDLLESYCNDADLFVLAMSRYESITK